MKHNVMLTIASRFAIPLAELHIRTNIVPLAIPPRKADPKHFIALAVLVVFLYGLLCSPNGDRGTSSCCSVGVVRGRQWPFHHMRWAHYCRRDRQVAPAAFFFVCTSGRPSSRSGLHLHPLGARTGACDGASPGV